MTPPTLPLVQGLTIFDGLVPDPQAYREAALALKYGDVELGGQMFKGIALCHDLTVPYLLQTQILPGATPLISFFRQSPAGQVEPNYIHADDAMGDWTTILYLNPTPPPGDGTTFWRYRPTGALRGTFDAAQQGRRAEWEPWCHVDARFNRLLVFESDLYHSRALEANYGDGYDARLTQVTFAGIIR